MRLDHLLSKEASRGCVTVWMLRAECGDVQGETDNLIFPVTIRLGETPVPIPNTMVKTQAADGTILETIWESRWLPDPNFHI